MAKNRPGAKSAFNLFPPCRHVVFCDAKGVNGRRAGTSVRTRIVAQPLRTLSVVIDPSGQAASRWTDPALVAEAHAWMREMAARGGWRVTGEIAQPHVQPWSTVFRAATDRGDVFLKLCGPSQAHEPALTALLAPVARTLLPEVIVIHPTEPWMLLADGGIKLRDAVTGQALMDTWAALLPRYAELQRALLGHEDDLLATGTPDRRIAKLADQLGAVIDDERVLAPLSDDTLAPTHAGLRALLPQIASLADELASFGIGTTIDHDDLHDANVLVRDGNAVVFDWGDACVTHPFLSLWIVRRIVAHRLAMNESDPTIARLVDAYLEPWTTFAPIAALRRAAEIGAHLGSVTRALCWYRVVRLNPGLLADEPEVVAGSLENIRGAIAPDAPPAA